MYVLLILSSVAFPYLFFFFFSPPLFIYHTCCFRMQYKIVYLTCPSIQRVYYYNNNNICAMCTRWNMSPVHRHCRRRRRKWRLRLSGTHVVWKLLIPQHDNVYYNMRTRLHARARLSGDILLIINYYCTRIVIIIIVLSARRRGARLCGSFILPYTSYTYCCR